MAITGTGTQGDPFVVHSYSEFISLSGHASVADNSLYIQFFEDENPNQVIDCNAYGSEFKWRQFGVTPQSGTYTIYINLNGCTIKNLIIYGGESMFKGEYFPYNGNGGKIVVSNGSLLNIFMGSATSAIATSNVEFHDVSISLNMMGSTVPMFNNNQEISDSLLMDNCSLYLVASTLSTYIFNQITMIDTDIELHIFDLNDKPIFEGTFSDATHQTKITDCRIQGKIGGRAFYNAYTNGYVALGALSSNNMYANNAAIFTNCVIDVDFTDSEIDYILYTTDGGESVGTNVICKDHIPLNYNPPSSWNYMTHSQIRDGDYLNSKGFTVVEVAGG